MAFGDSAAGLPQAPLQEEVATVFFPFGGAGGGALGFQESEVVHEGRKLRFQVVGGIDNDPQACQDFETLTGVKETCASLFSYDQEVTFRSEWRLITNPHVVRILESGRRREFVVAEFSRENRDERHRRYRKFQSGWWKCVRRVDPPADWHELTPEDVVAAAGGDCPKVMFTSPPCKGFSGLLPKKSAESPKYLVMDELVIRGLVFMLESFLKVTGKKPALLLLENVPRIVQRGKWLLDIVKAVLESYGYVWSEGYHDAGAIARMAQFRRRYLLGARDPSQLASFVYEPPEQPLRPIGDEIGKLAFPNDRKHGDMHQLPKLSLTTWLRLALIPAGGDWRDLERVSQDLQAGRLRIVHDPELDVYRIVHGDAVEQAAAGLQEAASVGLYQAAAAGLPDLAASVAVPEKAGRSSTHFKVTPADQPSGTVTGATHVANGLPCVQDVRIDYTPQKGTFGVTPWTEPGGTVIGNAKVRGSAMAAVADVRIEGGHHDGFLRVGRMDEPSPTVTASVSVSRSNGMAAIADSRMQGAIDGIIQPGLREGHSFPNKIQVASFQEPYPTVTGSRLGSGQVTIADERTREALEAVMQPGLKGSGDITHPHKYAVAGSGEPYPTVTGSRLGSGQVAYADDRTAGLVSGLPLSPAPNGVRHDSKYKVQPFDQPARTVDGNHKGVGAGQACVADTRLSCKPRNGTMGVLDWDRPSTTVIGSGDIHAGSVSVADVRTRKRALRKGSVPDWSRPVEQAQLAFDELRWAHEPPVSRIAPTPMSVADPRATLEEIRRLLVPGTPLIISEDGAWHRPLTTFELAMLQGFPAVMRDGRPLTLAGKSDARRRERIGNAVPPPAAKVIAGFMGVTLLLGKKFELRFGDTRKVWVSPTGEVVPGPLEPIEDGADEAAVPLSA